MTIRSMYWAVAVCVVLGGCDQWQRIAAKKSDADPVVASVGAAHLSQSDLAGLTTTAMTPADSAATVSRYVDAWVKKQLLLQRAQNEVKFDDAELERKMLDYRYALMVYEFEKAYVQKHLDTVVTDKEIHTYYEGNLANFELKQNIVKGRFVCLPANAPTLAKVRQLIRADDEKSRRELKGYCFKFANSYHLNDSTWIDVEHLVANSPFRETPNKVQFLKQSPYAETTDDKFVYLLAIKDYKISSQTSPLEFVRSQIRNIMLNRRKVVLIQELEKATYKQAEQTNAFKINLKS